jgi:alpha-N-acetylglucosamine transferase
MKKKDYAFVLIHFRDNIKYLELELYFIINLKNFTNNDIIYMYSINDTPNKFIEIIKKYCQVLPYNDNNITFNVQNFKSSYSHFNTLRTCNFLFAYQLTQYKKICVIESDMIILNNIDDIFELNVPSILSFYDKHKILENYPIKLNSKEILDECSKKSMVNGGLMLFKPSLTKYKLLLKNLRLVINENCIYPNETLFLISHNKIYNLPFRYNVMKHHINNIETSKIKVLHFNTKYKHIDIIKDNYLEQTKNKNKLLYDFLIEYKKKYYDKLKDKIKKILK